jgi:hypothetical protein
VDEMENINPQDELKAENELLKIKLELEHGMTHSESKLSPEMENEWLNYINNFEQRHKDCKRVTVYEFIGKPEFKKPEDLKDEEVEAELDRWLGLMDEKGVSLDVLAEYPPRVIYQFITGELFEHETDDIHIEGMKTWFIYEDFYPRS